MILLGAFNGGSGADKDGNCTICLDSVLPWQKNIAMFSGRKIPGKTTQVRVPFAVAEKFNLGDIFFAICKASSQPRTYDPVLPLFKVGENAFGKLKSSSDYDDWGL